MASIAHKRIAEARRRAEEVAEFYADLSSVFERAESLGIDILAEIQQFLDDGAPPSPEQANGSATPIAAAPGSSRDRLDAWYARGSDSLVGRQVALGIVLFGVGRTNREIADEIKRLGFHMGARDPVGYVRNLLLPEVKKKRRLRFTDGRYEIAGREAEESIREELDAQV